VLRALVDTVNPKPQILDYLAKTLPATLSRSSPTPRTHDDWLNAPRVPEAEVKTDILRASHAHALEEATRFRQAHLPPG